MKRPHIPMRVRVHAAEMQAERSPRVTIDWWLFYNTHVRKMPLRKRLDYLLDAMFDGEEVQLDHDPALSLRKQRNGKYRPDANNPHFLVYRLKADHLQKTTGRKPGAERTVTTKGSDIWLARKYRAQNTKTKKPKRKIPSRPFSRHGTARQGGAG